MSASAVAVSVGGQSISAEMSWAIKLRLQRLQHVVQQARHIDPLAAGIALAGEVQQIADGRFEGRKAGHDFVEHIDAAAIFVDAPPEQAQIELHRHQAVAHLVGDVRCHLPEIGQPIFACQLAVFRFQFIRQTANLGRSASCVCCKRSVASFQAAKIVCRSSSSAGGVRARHDAAVPPARET